MGGRREGREGREGEVEVMGEEGKRKGDHRLTLSFIPSLSPSLTLSLTPSLTPSLTLVVSG